MKLDIDHITKIISEVAEEEIMPRWRSLADGDIMEKSPGDVVTVADIEAEKKLTARLQDHLPGSLVVGEEAVSNDKSVLNTLDSDQPVWIIDPVDGTRNFAKGDSVFGSMVALCKSGEIIAGWIHDPARKRTAIAEKGAGAELAGRSLHVKRFSDLQRMTVSLNEGHRRYLEHRAIDGRGPIPRMAIRYGSVAHDYISLACGEFHCAQYVRLHPWDHAPGILLHREAGGYDRLMRAKTNYQPKIYQDDCLLITPNEEVWEAARAFLNPGEENKYD